MGRSTFDAHATAVPSSDHEVEEIVQQLVTPHVDTARLVGLFGDVSEQSIHNVSMQILHLAHQNHRAIHLMISSYGGSIDEMFSLYDTIKFVPCPIHTVAMGKVMSAGVLLLASGEKGKRMIGRSARLMIHPVSGGAIGNVFAVLSSAKEHARLQELMVDSLVKETKMSKTKINQIMECGYDFYLTAEDALKFGIVDMIIPDKKPCS